MKSRCWIRATYNFLINCFGCVLLMLQKEQYFHPLPFSASKNLCDVLSQFICIGSKLIKTPIGQTPFLIQYWCITPPFSTAASKHPDKLLCHLGRVETIMVVSSTTVLDQITADPIYVISVALP
jgi:hypothetical protein